METQVSNIIHSVFDWVDRRRIIVISTVNSLVLFATVIFASFAVRSESLHPAVAEASSREGVEASSGDSRSSPDRNASGPARARELPRRWSPGGSRRASAPRGRSPR